MENPIVKLLYASEEFRQERNRQAQFHADLIKRNLAQRKTCFNLDFGCGHGEVLATLQRDLPETTWTGLDIYNGMKTNALGLVLYDGESSFPFPRYSFDNVAAVGVLHHIPMKQHPFLIEEIFRILRPGGRFILLEPFIGKEQEIPVLSEYIRAADAGMNIGVPGGQIMNHQTLERWKQLMFQQDFQMVNIPEIHIYRAAIVLPWCGCDYVFQKRDRIRINR